MKYRIKQRYSTITENNVYTIEKRRFLIWVDAHIYKYTIHDAVIKIRSISSQRYIEMITRGV